MIKIQLNRIWTLVVLAMIALLFIQVFQLSQIFERTSDRLKHNINTTIERIALQHEKAVDIRRYMHIVNKDFSGQYKDVLKQEFKQLLSVQESIKIQDTTIFQNGELNNYLIIKGSAYDTLSGVSTEQKVLARDVREIRDLFDKQNGKLTINDTNKVAIQLDQRVLQQIFKKAKFVNDLMIEAFKDNIYESPSERVDVAFLDSVIRHEISNDDLPQEYQFMVADKFGAPVKYSTRNKNYSIKLDTLKTANIKLFPNNVLDDEIYLHIFFPKPTKYFFNEMWLPFLVSLLLMGLILGAMIFMFKTILSQKKLSELKNDFVSNMTHELKTPISTISLACEAISDSSNKDDVNPYVKMIGDENKRLSLVVDRILQNAVLERGEGKLTREKIILNEIIHEVVHHAQFRIQNIGGSITLSIPKELIEISADKMHLTNVITNLIDNAIKYSEEDPEINIIVKQENKKIYITVKDKGIGIKKENIHRIFDNLYRVPTGNVHNVKGFGLGLSYVKAVTQLHGWNVQVKSKFGEGSEFTLIINQ